MFQFLIRRFAVNCFVFLCLSFVIYQLMVFMPGDPLDTMIASVPNISNEDIARLKTLYGLDQPGYIRYLHWLTDIFHGDLGYSRTYKIRVTEIISTPLWNTFLLSTLSLVLALVIAIPLGVWSSLKKNSLFDYLVNLIAYIGISIPSFWLGILLILCFAVKFSVLPAGGTISADASQFSFYESFLDRAKHLILPVLSLTFFQMGGFIRYTRGAMLEVLQDDYIRTAQAKGAKTNRIIFVHALKNALIPLITIVSISMGNLLSGAVITETVFSYNGLGRLIYNSIMGNDFNVAMVGLLLVVFMILLMNTVGDSLYALVDPRVEIHRIR